ncbi:mucin-2-like isoform X2 [Clupea harengus]|uniref:Mucin-2-like isoform X2 n=1 Tax=Clupea harengus TaxID=7950 RepID=A0A6P8H5J1_CLUHA|nr:mucin-2-like isoform X2 [Clupea harengus]
MHTSGYPFINSLQTREGSLRRSRPARRRVFRVQYMHPSGYPPSSTDSKPEEEVGVEVVPPEDVSFVSNTCTPVDIPSSTASKPEKEVCVEVSPPEDVSFMSNTCTPVDIPSSTDSKPEEEVCVEVVPPEDVSFVSNTCTPVDIPSSTDSQPEEEVCVEVVPPEDVSFVSPLEDTFVEALKPIDPDVSVMDTSIGSATLLDTFEGLSHNDIVTLTLEQVKVEAKAKNRKASLDPPAVGGAAEPLVAEETEPTEVSSPVIRRSSRIAIKQIERKVKQNSRRNNIREGENPEPQALKTPEKLKTTPQRKKAQSVNILSPTRQNLAQHTSTPQNTTLFIPVGQIHGPAPTGAQNSSLFNNTALGSTPYIPVGGNLDQNLTSQILDLQNPTLLSVPSDNLVQQTQATQNISLQTLKVQQTTKPASPKQNPGLKTPTKRKVERLLFVVRSPTRPMPTVVQNPALLTGTAVQNPALLTGTAVQNPMQLTGTAVQNPALLTGTAVQNPTPLKGTIKRNPTPLKRTMVQNPALLTGTVVQIPTRLTSSVTNPSLLNPPVQNSTQLLQTVPYPKCSQNPQSKIQTSLTPAAQNSVQPTPVIQNLTAKTLKTQSPVVQTPAKRNKSAKTPAIQKPTTQTLAPKTVKALATQNPTMMSLATHNPTVQILSTQNLPAQTPGMQNLAQNTQAAHIPAVPTATTKYPPPPQTPQTQNPTAQTTPVDNLAMDTVITLNLDIEMDYTEPDELQAPELILPSIVTPRPQHGRLPMSTSVETPFVASFTPVPPPPSPSPSPSLSATSVSPKCKLSPPPPSPSPSPSATSVSPKCKLSPPPPSPSPSLSATSVSPKCKLSPPQPSKPQPNPPPQSQERNTKTTALPKVTLKHDLNSAPLVKPQMFSGFKVQQREAPSSSSRLGGSGGLQGFLTKQPLTTPSLPQAPLSAPQKPTPGKMAARPDCAPKGQAALMKIKKDPDQVPEDVKTASLRLKMLKKLKAKKKELAKLDYMLRERGMVPAPQACSAPPSVICGASADTSPASSQLLSPGTPSTPSTMSSDGADMLEMLAGGGGDAFGHLMSGSAPENPQNLYPTSAPLSAPSTAPAPDFLTIDDFLDDVIFDTNAPEKVVENTEFDTLDMFL